MSGNAEIVDAEHAGLIENASKLRKPFRSRDLLSMVDRIAHDD